MKPFRWNDTKNQKLKLERKISFEDVESAIHDGFLLDIIEHPNQNDYAHQKIMIVKIMEYAHMVPYIEEEDSIFLITVIPSRKMTKRYLRSDSDE